MQFINHVDKDGNNLLFNAVIEWRTKEIVELTWNEIKSFLTHEEQVEYLKLKGENGKNLKKIASKNINEDHKEEVIAWIDSQLKYYKINL